MMLKPTNRSRRIHVVGFQNAVMEVMAVQVMVAVTPVIHDNNII
jgi:hypothetical protein